MALAGLPASVPVTRLQLGPRGVASTLVNRQNLQLATYWWPAQRPKGVVLTVHGHGAHIEIDYLKSQGPGKPAAYEGSWVERLNAAGWSVCGLDNQGCGRSGSLHGWRCYVECFDDYVADVVQLAESLPAAPAPGFAGLPVFLMGASLGGCIALHAIWRKGQLFRGAALLAPMLSLQRISRKGLNPYIRPLSQLLSWLCPWLPAVAADTNTMYPDIQADWDADPLAWHGKTRVRNAVEYLRVTERLADALPSLSFPFIVFHSENDTMCDPDGSKRLHQQAASKDKTLRLVNQMWHVIMKEAGNDKVLAEILEWMEQRL